MIYRYMFLLCLLISGFMGTPGHASDKQSVPTNSANGVLYGQFMVNDRTPLANGRLFLYNDESGPSAPNAIMRVPDNITTLDNNGRFDFELPPGTYRLSASKMPESGPMGPPLEGEPVYFKMDSAGAEVAFTVTSGKKTNAGVISTSRPMIRNYKGKTLIQGQVLDASDSPVKGAVIYAYLDPGIVDKAYHVSEKTAADGKFVLSVNRGGTYYLRVRGEYGGGIPKEGEIIDVTVPTALTPVTVNDGETLTGVIIRVKLQPQRGPLFQDTPKK